MCDAITFINYHNYYVSLWYVPIWSIFTSFHLYLFFTSQSTNQRNIFYLGFFSCVTAKWQEIGNLLGVDTNNIEMLYSCNFFDQMKMSKMLQSWLDNEPTPVTWDHFISVIEGPLQMKSLAIDIRQFLGIESGQLFY